MQKSGRTPDFIYDFSLQRQHYRKRSSVIQEPYTVYFVSGLMIIFSKELDHCYELAQTIFLTTA